MVLGSFAVTAMLTKNAFLEEIRKQYVLTARAKGLGERRVLWKHVFRNALIPIITGFPAAFIGAFFTGSLLIETLFSLDGLGLLSYESVIRRDYPVVLGTLFLFTLIGLVTKLISDLCYVWVDPVSSSTDPDPGTRPSASQPVVFAWPTRLAALPAQPPGYWSLVLFCMLVAAEPGRRADLQRPAAAGALRRGRPTSRCQKDARDDLRRRLRHRTDYLDPFIRQSASNRRQLGAVPAQPLRART
jgi:hypothetical protein